MWAWIVLAAFILIIVILYLASPLISPPPMSLRNAHVVITGGSSGIGKSLALSAVKQGAKVTLVARDKRKLEEASQEISSSVQIDENTTVVQTSSVDLSTDYNAVEAAFREAESTFGPVDILINSAGNSVPGRFEDLAVSDFQKMMNINYMSAVHATRAVIEDMKKRGRGRVTFVSSQAGQIGLFGFTAYSASKFALRGLAEALQMEVKPYNVHVTLAFPPDTNTPGFQEEQKSKPPETKLMSETAGLFLPEQVASTILRDTLSGRFFSSMGLDGVMLSSLTCGFSPITSIMEPIFQVTTMGIFRLVSLFYLWTFDRIASQGKLRRYQEESSKKKP